MRKIIHIDMDCFFAAVEIRDQPDLSDKPVAVGGVGRRGVLTTCNYVARKFGCRSGMPGFKAKECCPELVMIKPNFHKYKAVSSQVRAVYEEYTRVIEPLSLDEAFLDVTDNKDRYAWDIAKEIRRKIFDRTQLTASAGVAPNKMLAKIASDWRKPNGQFVVLPDGVDDFMRTLPVAKVWGIGKKTQERLSSLGVQTCGDLQLLSEPKLAYHFGKFGKDMYRLCRGMDDREVKTHRIRKSMSTEQTYIEDITEIDSALLQMKLLCDELLESLKRSKHKSRPVSKVFVKLKFSDFQSTTKETVSDELNPSVMEPLLREAWTRGNHSVRLIGVGVRFAELERVPDEQMQFVLSELS